MFQGIVNRVNATLHSKNSQEPQEDKGDKQTTEEEEQHEVESTKNESKLITILEKARELYIEKGLVGNISITSSFTVFYASVACDIDGVAEQEKEHEDVKPDEIKLTKAESVDQNTSSFVKMAISGVNKCISMLERRAVAYGVKPYKSKLSLTNTIYVTLPILSMMTISVSCTATVASLNAAAEKDALKASLLKASGHLKSSKTIIKSSDDSNTFGLKNTQT